jgi:DNA-binding PadR family transcriptional regulator
MARHIPTLKPTTFHILAALADGPRHGYAIRTEVEARTEGRVRLWPATLYGSIRELEKAGLIAESPVEVEPDDDPRRRYYALTPLGRRALADEAERMRELANAALRALKHT